MEPQELALIGTILLCGGLVLASYVIINLYRKVERKRMLKNVESEPIDDTEELE